MTSTAIKTAMRQGDDYFAQYCLDRCGVAYRAINVAKPGAKIPRWKFEELDSLCYQSLSQKF